MATPTERDGIADAVFARAWLVASGGAVGVVVGMVAVLAFGTRGLAETVFVLGAVCFGFGLLGWSGSILAGRGVEQAIRLLDAESDWTEAASRRAMARVIGFGAGVMLGVTVVGQATLALA